MSSSPALVFELKVRLTEMEAQEHDTYKHLGKHFEDQSFCDAVEIIHRRNWISKPGHSLMSPSRYPRPQTLIFRVNRNGF